MPWKAIACSEIGTSHQKSRLPCQDYTEFIRLNNAGKLADDGKIVIGAVSDGAGSCKYSDIGSKLAVITALKHLKNCAKELKENQKDSSPEILEDWANQAFVKILEKVKERFGRRAKEKSCSPKDFSCTLLVVIASPNWLVAMQIGDGFIVTRNRKPKSEYKLLFHPSKGEYANETTFVTAANALEKMQVKTLFDKQQFICAASDGLERMAINLKDLQPHPPFFKMFERALEIRPEDEERLSTKDWLKSKDVNNKTDDDKTILLFWYEYSQPGGNISPPKVKRDNRYYTIFLFNVLSGMFWNSLYHDLFVDIKFNDLTLQWMISVLIAVLLTVVIILVNFYIYKPLKYSKSLSQKVKSLFDLLIISFLGLALGGALYYSIRKSILYLFQLQSPITTPK